MMGKVFFSILCVWSWIGRLVQVRVGRLLLVLAGLGWARLGGRGGAEYSSSSKGQIAKLVKLRIGLRREGKVR